MDDRFKVTDTIFVSRTQPNEDDLQRLAAAGFASVVDLRQLGEGDQPLLPPLEAAAAGRNGLRYAHIPIPTDRLDHEMLDRVSAALAAMPGPVLVHCASGKRSGTFAIAYAAARSGATGRAALANIEAAGAAYGSEAMHATLRRYVDRKAGRARLQDVLGLGSEARMNVPGVHTLSNWSFRFHAGALTEWHVERLLEVTRVYGRG